MFKSSRTTILAAVLVAVAGLTTMQYSAPAEAAWPWTYCVDADHGNDANDGISTYDGTACLSGGGHGPWATMGRHNGTAQLNPISGLNAVGPGDTELVVASSAAYDNGFFSGIPGTAANPVLFTGVVGVRGACPLVKPATTRAGAIQVSASVTYATFQCFDVTSDLAMFTASISGTTMTVTAMLNSGTIAAGQTVVGDGVTAGTTVVSGPAAGHDGTYTLSTSSTVSSETIGSSINPNMGGILLGSSGSPNTVAYVTIQNTRVYWTGAFGIGSTYGEHFTIQNNIIHDNGFTLTNASDSGVSIYSPCNYDSVAGYHNYVLNNIIYNQWAGHSTSPGKTDGQDIIMDDFFNDQQTYCGAGHPPYTGATLIAGNVGFGAEGGGLKVYNNGTQALVDVFNNTFWNNCQGAVNFPCGIHDGDVQVLGFGGIFASNVNIQGNTIVGRYYGISAKGLTGSGNPVAATLNNNDGTSGQTFWDNSGTFTSTCSIGTDPLLQNPQLNPAGADFRPTTSTPVPAC